MATPYGIKNRDTIKKTRRWLEANNIDYHFHDYCVDGLNNELLNGFTSELGWKALLNARGTAWCKSDETTHNKITDAAFAVALMTEMPAITRRPLLYAPGKPMSLGFNNSSYQQFFHEVQSMSCSVIELTQQLIRRPSLSPDDARCQVLLIERLQAIGFTVERMDFANTQSLQAQRGQGEMLAFTGHTNMVPPGDADRWINPPLEPTIRDGMLLGRDAADMKSSPAAMVVAVEHFVAQRPSHTGRLAFLITSDKKVSAHNGTVKVVEALMAHDGRLNYCLVGEPSSIKVVGDVVKDGRRGSLTCNLTIHGVQGHVAYPYLADNPVHRAAPFPNELVAIEWDRGNESSPATNIQIADIQAGTGSNNVIPGELFVQFDFRFSTEPTDEMIKTQVLTLLEEHRLRYMVDWQLSGQPFLTARGKLMDAIVNVVEHYNEIKPQLLTTGGTSGGHFIARIGAQVVELGPVDVTIRKVNECVNAADLQLLARMYQRVMEQLVV